MRAWQGRSHRWLTLVSASFDPHVSCNSLQCLGVFQPLSDFRRPFLFFYPQSGFSASLATCWHHQRLCNSAPTSTTVIFKSATIGYTIDPECICKKKFLCNFEETGGCEIPALVVYEGSRGEFSVSNSSRSAPIGRSLPCVPITNFPSQLLPSHNIWGKSRYLGRIQNFQFQLLTSIYVHFLCKVIDSITHYVPHVVLG